MQTVVRSFAFGALFVGAALLTACGGSPAEPEGRVLDDGTSAVDSADEACIDEDGDGFGEGCAEGPDCDDQDDTTFETCGVCLDADEGCECEPGTEPIECVIREPGVDEKLCKTGLRSCRDGAWTACEGIAQFD